MLPDAFDRTALLSNGRRVHIAPARPGDEPRIRAFYERLGDISTYYRFFGMRRTIPEAEFAELVSPAVRLHATMLASIDDEIIGIGEYHAAADPDDAEVAFAVSDDHHDEGIGTLLLEDLAVIAEHAGLRRLVASTLPGNGPMQVVFHTAGLDEQAKFDDGIIDFVMDLSQLDGLAAAATAREHQAVSRLLAPFVTADGILAIGAHPVELVPGCVAVVAGSSNGLMALSREIGDRRLGVSAVVCLADTTEVTIEDTLSYWARDPATRVVLMELERMPDGRRFAALARATCLEKPVVALIEATGRNASNLVDDCGIIRVVNRQQLLDLGAFFAAPAETRDSISGWPPPLETVGRAAAWAAWVTCQRDDAGTSAERLTLQPLR